MHRQEVLAVIHQLLGAGQESLLEEILREEDLPKMDSPEKIHEYLLQFPLSEKTKKTIKERVPYCNLKFIESWFSRENTALLDYYHPQYPEGLRKIANPPGLLYLQGRLEDGLRIALVGPRSPSRYGLEITRRIAGDLAENQVQIISGMARGIDRMAHETALEKGGFTIGVLGCGVDRIYPAENRDLFRKMEGNNRACLLSEFPLGFPPSPYTFPRRNRIISALAHGVLVTEAGMESGSLITARIAGEQGKTLYAVPGMITSPLSRGVHSLIKDGATLVEGAEDILLDLHPMLKIEADTKKILNLPPSEARLISRLEKNPMTAEEILEWEGGDISEVLRLLSLLEIKGLIIKEKNNKYFVML